VAGQYFTSAFVGQASATGHNTVLPSAFVSHISATVYMITFPSALADGLLLFN
jgi:hypothetical protein